MAKDVCLNMGLNFWPLYELHRNIIFAACDGAFVGTFRTTSAKKIKQSFNSNIIGKYILYCNNRDNV